MSHSLFLRPPTQILKLFEVIVLSNHWVGCIFYFAARVMDFDEHTWVRSVALDRAATSPLPLLPRLFFFLIATLLLRLVPRRSEWLARVGPAMQVYRMNELMLDGFEPESSSIWNQYLLVFFKGIIHLSITGYGTRGDNVPEMVLNIFVMVLQIFFISYILGEFYPSVFERMGGVQRREEGQVSLVDFCMYVARRSGPKQE